MTVIDSTAAGTAHLAGSGQPSGGWQYEGRDVEGLWIGPKPGETDPAKRAAWDRYRAMQDSHRDQEHRAFDEYLAAEYGPRRLHRPAKARRTRTQRV